MNHLVNDYVSDVTDNLNNQVVYTNDKQELDIIINAFQQYTNTNTLVDNLKGNKNNIKVLFLIHFIETIGYVLQNNTCYNKINFPISNLRIINKIVKSDFIQKVLPNSYPIFDFIINYYSEEFNTEIKQKLCVMRYNKNIYDLYNIIRYDISNNFTELFDIYNKTIKSKISL